MVKLLILGLGTGFHVMILYWEAFEGSFDVAETPSLLNYLSSCLPIALSSWVIWKAEFVVYSERDRFHRPQEIGCFLYIMDEGDEIDISWWHRYGVIDLPETSYEATKAW